jgi:pimeloyl-ACP methyl ester carboxylesterase
MFAAIQAKEYRKVSEILLKSPVFAVAPESQPLVRQMVTENERLWTVDRALMKLQPPTYGRLDQVKVPTLVIVGENDYLPARSCRRDRRQGPGRRGSWSSPAAPISSI